MGRYPHDSAPSCIGKLYEENEIDSSMIYLPGKDSP